MISGLLFVSATCKFTDSTQRITRALTTEKVTRCLMLDCSMYDALRSTLYTLYMLYVVCCYSMLDAKKRIKNKEKKHRKMKK